MTLTQAKIDVVCHALALVNANEQAFDLFSHQKLVAVGFALAGIEYLNTQGETTVLRRLVRDYPIHANLPDPQKFFYVLSVHDALFDLDGLTSWDKLLDAHNKGRAVPEQWSCGPTHQGGNIFSHILQEAGDRTDLIFETANCIKSQLLAAELDTTTANAPSLAKHRRI